MFFVIYMRHYGSSFISVWPPWRTLNGTESISHKGEIALTQHLSHNPLVEGQSLRCVIESKGQQKFPLAGKSTKSNLTRWWGTFLQQLPSSLAFMWLIYLILHQQPSLIHPNQLLECETTTSRNVQSSDIAQRQAPAQSRYLTLHKPADITHEKYVPWQRMSKEDVTCSKPNTRMTDWWLLMTVTSWTIVPWCWHQRPSLGGTCFHSDTCQLTIC